MRTRVLIVDNDPAVCHAVQAALAEEGISADYLIESAQAPARLGGEKFDVVFLAFQMSQPDGLALSRMMRASGFNELTPIVFMAEENSLGGTGHRVTIGANHFLLKPFERAHLIALITDLRNAGQIDERRYRRVPAECNVMIDGHRMRLTGTTRDLSLAGVLTQTPSVLAKGSEVSIRVQLIPGVPPLVGRGQVMRLVKHDGMGIQFRALSVSGRVRLKRFLLRQMLPKLRAIEEESLRPRVISPPGAFPVN